MSHRGTLYALLYCVAFASCLWAQRSFLPADQPQSVSSQARTFNTFDVLAQNDASPGKGDDAARAKEQQEYYELLKLFADTLDQVDRNYVKDISRRELMEAAIQGMIKKLDQYSNYIAPEEMEEFKNDVENEFGGIGIRVSVEDGRLRVISPLYGSPAYKAGLLAGDWIVEINGESTQNMSIDGAVKRMKGRIGTSVPLTVMHPGTTKRTVVKIERAIVRIPTVVGIRRAADDSWDYCYDATRGIAYIRITGFGRHTVEELKSALAGLKKDEKLSALVLDMRFNPGGLLSAAIETADLFVAKGRIVSTEGRNIPESVWDAHRTGTYEGFPIAVLVNRFSASASEIVSACLQDHKRAIVVGERTWGKGSVQNIIELEGGRSALKLTTASYQRPNGKNIHRFPKATEEDDWGVRPDPGFDVRFSFRENRRLDSGQRRLDVLSENARKAAAADQFTDRQLAKALEYLTAKLEGKSGLPEKPTAKKPAEKKPTEKKPTEKKPTEKKPTEKKPASKSLKNVKDENKKASLPV